MPDGGARSATLERMTALSLRDAARGRNACAAHSGFMPVVDTYRLAVGSPLSFAYFSLRRQRKVGAAPHRGNANRPLTKQGKAKAARTPTSGRAGKKPPTLVRRRRSRPMTKPVQHSSRIIISPATSLSDSLRHILSRHGTPNGDTNSKNINHHKMQNPRNHRQL